MNPDMAQVEELGDNRVRLTVDVSPHELEHAVEHAANDLAESVKIPGFRKGKVPLPVLLANVGKDRLWVEAIESHIGGWFWNAAARSRLRPVATPEYDFELPSSDDEPWSFSATIEIQPTPEIVDWTTLEVPRAEAEVPEELVQQELDALRQPVAELVPADDRAAREGDTLVVDLASERRGGSPTPSSSSAPEPRRGDRAALVGASVGDTRSVRYELGDGSRRRSTSPSSTSTRRCCRRSTTSSPARRASSTRSRSCAPTSRGGSAPRSTRRSTPRSARPRSTSSSARRTCRARARSSRRGRASCSNGFVRSLANRGISPEAYFQVTGQSPELLTAQIRAEAAQSVARELALEAVAEKAGIAVSDDDVKELIREQAEVSGDDAEAVIADIWAHGHQESLREDLRLRAALDRLAAEVKPISPEQHAAREAIWTPDKEKPAGETKLWTPGSKETR